MIIHLESEHPDFTSKFGRLLFIWMIIALFSCQSSIERPEIGTIIIEGESVFPFLNTGQDEDVILSWIESVNGTFDVLKVAKLEDNEIDSLTEVARGDDWFVNWADFPEISQFTSGKYITHWLQKSSTSTYDYNIHLAIGTFGQLPDTTFIIHSDGVDAEHGFVSYVPYNNDMMVVWLDGRDTKRKDGSYGQMSLRSAVIDDKGNKISDMLIDDRVCDCCQTDIQVVGGKPIVVYRDRDSTEIRDNYYAIFDGNYWEKGQPLANEKWTIAGCPVNGPAIDAIESTFATAWFTQADSTARVMVQFGDVDSEVALSSPRLVSDHQCMGRVDVMMINPEQCIVSWMEKGQEIGKIYMRKFNKNGPTGNPYLAAENGIKRSSGFPRMTLLDDILYLAYTDVVSNAGIVVKKINLNQI